ncbi:DciA family protein [Nocardiopsis chromatogenes]|uniref:DciA family protein n=1 Tax=Nocardiopsis chromatogenes TaxID=280239 RepID=UPI00037ADF65
MWSVTDGGAAPRPAPGAADAQGAQGAQNGGASGGQDPSPAADAPSGIDLARQALAQARAAAKERGAAPGPRPQRRRGGRMRSRRDPQLFGDAVRAWLTERGYAEQIAVGGVFGRWSDIVGEFNAQHLRPVSYEAGELVVAAESATMAAHARAMARDLIRRLNEELGQGTVHAIKVTGPGRGRGAGRLRAR